MSLPDEAATSISCTHDEEVRTMASSVAFEKFEKAIVTALPRDMSDDLAHGWAENPEGLARVLRAALMPQDWQSMECGSLSTAAPSVPQPPQATIVAEFAATVNRDDPQWKRAIDETQYYYVNPNLTVERFPLQGIGTAEEKCIDLDFSNWDHNPMMREILVEATRLGCTRLDRAASESSLNVRPTGPNGRPVACICTDEWTERGCGVVGYVVESSLGRGLDVGGLDDDRGWDRGYCVFRFRAPRK